jgi:hypothetical protein
MEKRVDVTIGATGWRWLLGIYTTIAADVLIIDYHDVADPHHVFFVF